MIQFNLIPSPSQNEFATRLFLDLLYGGRTTHDKETLEAVRDQSLKKLSEEAEQLKEQTRDHLHKVEEGLLKQRQEAEAFNENFSQRQTQLFDKMDSFLGGSKGSSKTESISEK